jgi:enoyl-CoA hydratase/carnithine racemase
MLGSRWVSGAEAVTLGLAARCCEPESLENEALEASLEIAAQPGPAVEAAKRLLRHGWAEAILNAIDRESAAARALRAELGPLGA